MKLRITVSFQEHSILQTLMSILGCILVKLIYIVPKSQTLIQKILVLFCSFEEIMILKIRKAIKT